MYFERIKFPAIYTERFPGLNTMEDDSGADSAVLAVTRSIATTWSSENRPYYRLYPGVIDFLMHWEDKKLWKLDLSCLPLGLRTLEIEIPQEYWSTVGFSSGILYPVADKDHIAAVVSSTVENAEGLMLHMWNHAILQDGPDDVVSHDGPLSPEQNYALRKIFSGVIAIGDNPDIVKAVPLAKDKAKYERTLDQQYIDKARRRGVFGFDVGKDIPTREEFNRMVKENEEAAAQGRRIPHIRAACLATYHTGKGGCTPKIILRKSCLVNKDLIKQVPQGYYGKKDAEEKEK